MLSNHCPECYSNEGLRLTFKQRFVENPFYKSIAEDLKNEIYCLSCHNTIYSGRWEKDIEQVVAYHERANSPKPKSMKMKTTAWLGIGVLIAVIVLVILFSSGIINL